MPIEFYDLKRQKIFICSKPSILWALLPFLVFASTIGGEIEM